jgi:hypothetical protein
MAANTAETTSSEPEKSADELRAEMRQIRREMGRDVEVLVEHAERLMDWRYYVHRYPWATVGVAAFLGYYLVPQRTVVMPTDERTLERIAAKIPVMVKSVEPGKEEKKTTLFGSLINMGMNAALRAAQAYASQQLGKFVTERMTAPQQPPRQHAEMR